MSSTPELALSVHAKAAAGGTVAPDRAVDAGWCELMRRLASEADPGWLPDWPEALVRCAQRSALGCRLISVRLGATVAPYLFSTLSPPPAAVLARHNWLHLSQAALVEAVMDVGAMAMSPAIHTVVRRDQMRRVRTALGEQRYRRALDVVLGSASAPIAAQAQARLNACIDCDAAIVEYCRVSGLIELGTVLANGHPSLEQRLRIAFPPSQALQVQKGWLPRQAVLDAMEKRCQDTGDSADGH